MNLKNIKNKSLDNFALNPTEICSFSLVFSSYNRRNNFSFSPKSYSTFNLIPRIQTFSDKKTNLLIYNKKI